MALGGVATGSINAQEAAKVKGKMSSVTGILILTATAAKIGTSSAVLASGSASLSQRVSISRSPCARPQHRMSRLGCPVAATRE